MSSLIIAVIAVLCVIFLIILLTCAADKGVTYITASDLNNPETVECCIREILKKNPKSEIIVIDKSHSNEITGILARMQRDYPEIRRLCERLKLV